MGQTPRGVPISHNALQHYPECHGADTWGGTHPGSARGVGGYPAGGYPAVGYPARMVPCQGVPCLGMYPGRVSPSQVRTGGTLLGGTQVGTPPQQGTPRARSGWGGTQLRQQKEYSLHGGRYASCVHAGGLSCFVNFDTYIEK